MPSPFDIFLKNLTDAIEDTANDFLQEVNREAKSTIRRMAKGERPIKLTLNTQGRAKTVPGKGKVHTPTPKPSTPQRTFYDALEVSPVASPETVSAAFRSLSARFHPDNQKTGNAERYKEITEAWATLKDGKKRREYDRRLK